MESTTAEEGHSAADGGATGNEAKASESKDEAEGNQAELAGDKQHDEEEQQDKGGCDDDGGDASMDGGGAEGKGDRGDVSRDAEGKEADDGAGIGPDTHLEEKPNARDDDGGKEASADHTAPAAAESKGQHVGGGGGGGGGGGVEPPLSPPQQQQQQQQQQPQQHAATTATQENQGDGASSVAPSAPLAPTWPAYCDPTYRMPEELAVRVLVDGEVREMSIKVERFEGVKLFQGGYRHRGTGRVFHHASTQFGQRERPLKKTGHLRTRDTQTCKIRTTTMQTTNECGTQVSHSLHTRIKAVETKNLPTEVCVCVHGRGTARDVATKKASVAAAQAHAEEISLFLSSRSARHVKLRGILRAVFSCKHSFQTF